MAANNKHWPLHGKQWSTVEMWLQKGIGVVDAEIAAGGMGLDLSGGSLPLTQLGLHGVLDGAKQEVTGGIPL